MVKNAIKLATCFIIIFCALFGVSYVVVSFASGTFDISLWNEDARIVISIIGGLFSAAISISITLSLMRYK